eukprot:1148648-Pelagomonas_calceolata.AAC.9
MQKPFVSRLFSKPAYLSHTLSFATHPTASSRTQTVPALPSHVPFGLQQQLLYAVQSTGGRGHDHSAISTGNDGIQQPIQHAHLACARASRKKGTHTHTSGQGRLRDPAGH